jgi:hypothetical protein
VHYVIDARAQVENLGNCSFADRTIAGA